MFSNSTRVVPLVTVSLWLCNWQAAFPQLSGEESMKQAPVPQKIRIGVYDPRAVAVAYTHSQLFQQRLDPKLKDLEKARAANDQNMVKQLEAWGEAQQIRCHLQGFAGAPVGDILSEVKDQLPRIAETANVQAISQSADYTNPEVDVVDITGDLIKLWSPDAATLKMISRLKKTTPVPIEEVAKMRPRL